MVLEFTRSLITGKSTGQLSIYKSAHFIIGDGQPNQLVYTTLYTDLLTVFVFNELLFDFHLTFSSSNNQFNP